MINIYEVIEAIIVTIIFELIMARILGIKNKKDLGSICLVNLITCTISSISYSLITAKFPLHADSIFYVLTYLCIEAVVIVLEYFMFKKMILHPINKLKLSICLNVFSCVGSFVLYTLLGLILNS